MYIALYYIVDSTMQSLMGTGSMLVGRNLQSATSDCHLALVSLLTLARDEDCMITSA